MRPYLVARTCTLADDSTDNPMQPFDLAADELHNSTGGFWALTEEAALMVRNKRLNEAVNFAERSLEADGRPGRAVLNWLWLALAHQTLGNLDTARRWRNKAIDWLNQQRIKPADSADMGLHLHNWLEAHVLWREVEGLIPAAKP